MTTNPRRSTRIQINQLNDPTELTQSNTVANSATTVNILSSDSTIITPHSNKRKSVTFLEVDPVDSDQQQLSLASTSTSTSTKSPRTSTGVTAATSTSSSSSSRSPSTVSPSAKSLGKRRAISPTSGTTTPVSSSSTHKRVKTSHSSSLLINESPSTIDSAKYNLRSRLSIEESTLPSSSSPPPVPSTDLSTSASIAPVETTETMPRKGSRASRAVKAKEQALEEDGGHNIPDSPSSSAAPSPVKEIDSTSAVYVDVDMVDAVASGSSNNVEEKSNVMPLMLDSTRQESGLDHSSSSSDDEEDQNHDSDEDEDDDDDGEGLHHPEDDEDEEEFKAQYAAEMAEGGLGHPYDDEEDDDPYGDGGGDLSDQLDEAPRTYDANGDPIVPVASNSSSNPAPGQTSASGAIEAAMAAHDAMMEASASYMRDGGGRGGGGGGVGGAGFRALQGMMAGMSTRCRDILSILRDPSKGASSKLVALQDLAELLSVSTEDTLAGYFQVDAFTKEIITILKGDANVGGEGDDDDLEGEGEGGMTREEMMAFGIDPSSQGSGGGSGGGGSGEEKNVQMMLLACRCLANLMEALPGSAHTVVYAGAVPVLCAKLMEIQYIDLAEQTMSTLEKISEEMPSAIVREGGLAALLTYLDFFSFHVQRTAVTAAANCCRSLSPDSFDMVRNVMPILKNVLGYPDQRVVEQACLAVVRIVESYRHYPDKLEALLTSEMLVAIRVLLNPDSTTVGAGTYTQILKMLSIAAKASPQVGIALIELSIAHTLYHLLTGVAAPEFPSDEGDQVVVRNTGEEDMLVMQNLVQRPKDQIQETLALMCELLPGLPKDGIFDPKAFSGKDRSRKVKSDGVITPVASSSNLAALALDAGDPQSAVQMEHEDPAVPALPLSRNRSLNRSNKSIAKDALTEKRCELLNAGPDSRTLVVKRFYALLLPILIDVYAASVNTQVRMKAVLGLMKIINFCDPEGLGSILKGVAISSFLAAILASRDQTSLVTNALQIVELLLAKLPDAYQYFFRREGVMHEIERLSNRPIVSISKSKSRSRPSDGVDLPTAGSSGFSQSLKEEASVAVSRTSTISGEEISNSGQLAANGTTSLNPLLAPADALASDMLTRRAQYVRDQYASADSEPAVKARDALELIRSLVVKLDEVSSGKVDAKDESDIVELMREIAALFGDEMSPVSSFELLESGLVEGLLRFTTESGSDRLAVSRRQEIVAQAFMPHLTGSPSTPAFSILVKRLQESLSRMEDFEVVLATSNSSEAESRRNGPSMLARQLKLRLVADEASGIPKSCSNVVVSIHAIATFQAFNDYLRPRILSATPSAERAGNGTGGRRGILDAFALAHGLPLVGSSSQTAATASGSTVASEEDASGRRRSGRLTGNEGEGSTKEGAAVVNSNGGLGLRDDDSDDGAGDVQQRSLSSLQDDRLISLHMPQLFSGDYEAPSPSSALDERPVNLELVEDGTKVEASTPDGTRVSTPTPSQTSATKARGSYASAVKAAPTDFHLAFKLGDQEVGLDTTIFGAVHNRNARSADGMESQNMWSAIHTVNFRKVDGPAPVENEPVSPEAAAKDDSLLTDLPQSIPTGSQQGKILQLLCVLHSLNSDYGESSIDRIAKGAEGLAESAFVNNKLTAKLNRQLEEPMIVASACLPEWSVDFPVFFPFLFPFDTRYTFLQSTSFGYARLMQKWVGQAKTDNSRRDDNLGFLGRLQRQKVRISRERMLESAFKVFELYGSSRASLEVEFFAEVGSGLGPTLEFYALVSKEFARKDLQLWRDGDIASPSAFVHNRSGLFPRPADESTSETGKKRMKVFKVLGQFVAKAMMDSRIIDVNFSRTFMKLVLGYELPLSIATVKTVDQELGRSLAHLQSYLTSKALIEQDETKDADERLVAIYEIKIDEMTIDELYLDFTLPGHSIELKDGGKDIPVDITNLEEYIQLVVEWTLKKGITSQMDQFKLGFSSVFAVRDLQSFTPSELVMLTGALEEDWSIESLMTATKADHGFSQDSRPVRDLLSIMSELSLPERREFLAFITGSPRLPIGGFSALSPPLTIVKKDGGDAVLASVMTCVNYLKLPNYSTRETLKARIFTSMRESEGFHLS